MADRMDIDTGTLDLNAGVYYGAEGPVTLTNAELTVTRILVEGAGSPVTRTVLAAALGHDGGASRAVDVVVSRLRRKLGDSGRPHRVITSVFGVGYCLQPTSKPLVERDTLKSFVPRMECDLFRSALDDSRAVMVCGASGAGKTHLVRTVLGHRGGVVWIDGDWATRAEGVVSIAAALGSGSHNEVDAIEALRRLDSRSDRVVVVERACASPYARPAIERALIATTRLKVVVIGMCDLEIAGARAISVGPLPPPDARSLLVERAQAVNPTFGTQPDDGQYITQIVELLDRLPGSIEVAATLARTMCAGELIGELRRVGTPGMAVPASLRLAISRLRGDLRGALLLLCSFRGEFSKDDAARLLDNETLASDALAPLIRDGIVARGESYGGVTWFRVFRNTRLAMGDEVSYPRLVHTRLRTMEQLTGPVATESRRACLASLRRWRADLEWLHEAGLQRALHADAARAALTLDPLVVATGIDLEGQVARLAAVAGYLVEPSAEAAVLRARAWAERLLGRHDEAEAHAREAIALLHGDADSFVALRSRLTLATILADAGVVVEPVDLVTGVADTCERHGWQALHIVALNAQARLEEVQGNLEDARQALTRAVAVAEKTKDAERMATLLLDLGGVHTRLGSFEEAEICYVRSQGADPSGAPLRAAAWSVGVGSLALARNDASAALIAFSRAATIHRTNGQSRAEVLAETYSGWALLDLGRFQESASMFGRAAATARRVGGPLLLGHALVGLTVAQVATGRLTAAHGTLDEARRVVKATASVEHLATIDVVRWWLADPSDRDPAQLERLAAGPTSGDLRETITILLGGAVPSPMTVYARVLEALGATGPRTEATA